MAERMDGKFMGAVIRAVKLEIGCPSATEGYWHDRSAVQRPLSNHRQFCPLHLCGGNLNKIGAGIFRGYSAGIVDTRNRNFLTTPIFRDGSEGPVADATVADERFSRENASGDFGAPKCPALIVIFSP